MPNMKSLSFAFLLVWAGCGSSSSNTDGPITPLDGGGASADTASDGAASDAAGLDQAAPTDRAAPADGVGDGATDGMVKAAATSFVLRNATGKAIYIQTSGFSSQGYWELLRDGKALPVMNTCELCDCAAAGCAVCGRALASVTKLEDGQSQSWDWDGRIWVPTDGIKPVTCEQESSVSPGPLTLRVTYSFSSRVDTSFGADDVFIGPALTQDLGFGYPPSAPVEIMIH
jgi:hypothetical protein